MGTHEPHALKPGPDLVRFLILSISVEEFVYSKFLCESFTKSPPARLHFVYCNSKEPLERVRYVNVTLMLVRVEINIKRKAVSC